MQRNPEYRAKVMMREVGTDSSAALVDFAGKRRPRRNSRAATA